jgi:hypothetical protein
MGAQARRTGHRDSLARGPILADLLSALLHLVESLGLVGAVTYGRQGTKIATIEACAHEIAHWAFMGPAFDSRLVNMSSRAANRHEASALRVEVAVLDHFGCKVSMLTLWVKLHSTSWWSAITVSCACDPGPYDCGAIRNKNRSTHVMGANAKRLVSRCTGHCSIRRI